MAASCKDEQFVTPALKAPGDAEAVASMRSLVSQKAVLNGIIWQYINDETGIIEFTLNSKSIFGESFLRSNDLGRAKKRGLTPSLRNYQLICTIKYF